MKKSLIAAAFASTLLPLSAFAQSDEPITTAPIETCIDLNATAQFCHAANDDGEVLSLSNGMSFIVKEGRVEDNGMRLNDCAAFFDDPNAIPAHVECY